MAQPDVPYDFEDFGMTADQLRAKYGAAGGHPEYGVADWESCTQDNSMPYWDWVASCISQDDDAMPGNDAQGNPLVEDAEKAEETVDVDLEVHSVEQAIGVIALWQTSKLELLAHMMKIPAKTSVTVRFEDGQADEEHILDGDKLVGFRIGLNLAMIEFAALPFHPIDDDGAGKDSDPPPSKQ